MDPRPMGCQSHWVARAIGTIFIVLGVIATIWISIQARGDDWYFVISIYSSTPVGVGMIILIGTEILREMRDANSKDR